MAVALSAITNSQPPLIMKMKKLGVKMKNLERGIKTGQVVEMIGGLEVRDTPFIFHL